MISRKSRNENSFEFAHFPQDMLLTSIKAVRVF